MQRAGKRHFVHEHPETSSTWETDELKHSLLRPEFDAAMTHMRAFGMTSSDEQGVGLVKKATRIVSSSPEVIRRIAVRCSNELEGPKHRHVQLVQGRAKAAQVYPQGFSQRVCEGIAAQKKARQLRHEITTADERRRDARSSGQPGRGSMP